jgi:hypothetical protein
MRADLPLARVSAMVMRRYLLILGFREARDRSTTSRRKRAAAAGSAWTTFRKRYVALAVGLTLVSACSNEPADGEATAGETGQRASASIEPADEEPSAEPPSGTATGPEDAVREYFEAGMTMDKDRVLAVVCSADQEQFEEAEPIAAERITSYSIGASREVLAGLTQVTVDFEDASGTTDTVHVPVLEEADGWKVCFSEGYRLPGA